jgi:hypothetical protein
MPAILDFGNKGDNFNSPNDQNDRLGNLMLKQWNGYKVIKVERRERVFLSSPSGWRLTYEPTGTGHQPPAKVQDFRQELPESQKEITLQWTSPNYAPGEGFLILRWTDDLDAADSKPLHGQEYRQGDKLGRADVIYAWQKPRDPNASGALPPGSYTDKGLLSNSECLYRTYAFDNDYRYSETAAVRARTK